MRGVTWVLLVGLALSSFAFGQFGVALGLAATKALLVGLEFMELRGAHRLHAAGFAAGVLVVTALLAVLSER